MIRLGACPSSDLRRYPSFPRRGVTYYGGANPPTVTNSGVLQARLLINKGITTRYLRSDQALAPNRLTRILLAPPRLQILKAEAKLIEGLTASGR